MHVSSPEAALRACPGSIPGHLPGVRRAARDGRPLTALPYRERREILNTLIPNGPGWLSPPHFPGEDLDAVRAASVANGLEGVVIKRLDSAYEPGARSGSWLKLKNVLRQEVVVAGWKPGQGNRAGLIGSLLVGLHYRPTAPAALLRSCRHRVLRRDAAHADPAAGAAAAAGQPVRRPGAAPSMPGPPSG